MFNIVIVGLGLIGGSAAMAAKGFQYDGEPSRIIGVDADEHVLSAAKKSGAICEAYGSAQAGEVVAQADLLLICLYPRAAFEFLKEHAHLVKPGAVVSDVCGVKGDFVERCAQLIPQASYVGTHPMAGREMSGFSAALPTLFKDCNYIITPASQASEADVELVRAFAKHLGAGRITLADAKIHDRNIAYTSQLAHVLAAAVVQNPIFLECKGFEGGSLADITRVAKLNSRMWSELFILNKEHLCAAVSQLEQTLYELRGMIARGDAPALERALSLATRNKELSEG